MQWKPSRPALLLSGLIALHTVDGRMVLVNPEQITQVMQPLPETHKNRQVTKGVNCIIKLTDGSFASVAESCAKVYRATETGEHGGLAVEKPGKGTGNNATAAVSRGSDISGRGPAPAGGANGGTAGGGNPSGPTAGNAGGGNGAGASGGNGNGGSGNGGSGGKGNNGNNGNHGQGNNGNGKGGKQ